jgi:hypothetical protein
LNYLLGQCREYYLDVAPPATIDGFLEQLVKLSTDNDQSPVLLNDEIQKQIDEQERFTVEQQE